MPNEYLKTKDDRNTGHVAPVRKSTIGNCYISEKHHCLDPFLSHRPVYLFSGM